MSANVTEQSRFVYRPPVNFVLLAVLAPLTWYVWLSPCWPLVVVCWLVTGYFGHTVVLAMHEAAHYHLHPSRWMNEARGVAIGVFTLTPLSVYRQLHLYHHAALSTLKDKELWPYNDPRIPRWRRVLAAWGEVLCGLAVTPAIYMHGFYSLPDVTPEVRRRAAWEYLLTVAFWSVVAAVVHYYDAWIPFVVAWVIPAAVSGNLQALRKFTEHLGLLSNDPVSASRTVLHPGPLGWFVTRSMLNIAHHGTHHRFGKIPYYELPEASTRLYGQPEPQGPVFPTYWTPFCDMLPSMANPRVGRQWCETAAAEQEAASLVSARR